MSFFEKLKLAFYTVCRPEKLISFRFAKPDPRYTKEANFTLKYGVLNAHQNMNAVTIAYDRLCEQYVGFKPLFIIENAPQCEYTNMHASSSYEMLDEDEYNAQNPDARDFPVAEFRLMLDILNDPEYRAEVSEFYGKFSLNYPDKLKALEYLNTRDYNALDEDIDVYLCPCERSTDAVARMIQGYFADDFEPEQTYAFILMMNERFGFEFIGIGATLMLFYRRKNLSDDKAEALLQELAKIYDTPYEAIKKALWHNAFGSRKTLVLPFAENIEDTVADEL